MIEFRFQGRALAAESGQTLAAALANAGEVIDPEGRPRLALCGMGVCQECALIVNGRSERACLVFVESGMEVESP
jgi:succinate dehydrogenase/fumarate reductase-like Fe-S protein